MSIRINRPPEETAARIREAIQAALEDSEVDVEGMGGHFQIRVVSSAFEGLNLLGKQRLVYRALAPLMAGDGAPVHAVDRLETIIPGTEDGA